MCAIVALRKIVSKHISIGLEKAMLSQGGPREAAVKCKFRYISRFTAASRGFHCDSTAFKLNNRKNHGKITALGMSIY